MSGHWPALLRTFRRNRALTQNAVADLLKVSTSAVSLWERGAEVPSLAAQKALRDLCCGTVPGQDSRLLDSVQRSLFPVTVGDRELCALAGSRPFEKLIHLRIDPRSRQRFPDAIFSAGTRKVLDSLYTDIYAGSIVQMSFISTFRRASDDMPVAARELWSPIVLDSREIVVRTEIAPLDAAATIHFASDPDPVIEVLHMDDLLS